MAYHWITILLFPHLTPPPSSRWFCWLRAIRFQQHKHCNLNEVFKDDYKRLYINNEKHQYKKSIYYEGTINVYNIQYLITTICIYCSFPIFLNNLSMSWNLEYSYIPSFYHMPFLLWYISSGSWFEDINCLTGKIIPSYIFLGKL